MKKMCFTALLVVTILTSLFKCVYAEEEKQLTDEEIKQKKEEILISIDGYINDINSKLLVIDQKIENTKKQEEFEYYPAIRLNIDTPMFGMSSIVENKLKIKKDVSTADIANKYSIRDIVKKRIIKLPEDYLAGIVVATKEMQIDDKMSLPELKLTLVKCIQYDSQVSSVEEFVDTQINKTFRDYIAQEKKDNIKDIKDRANKSKTKIEQIADKICVLSFIGTDISSYTKKYGELSSSLFSVTQKSKDTLMSKDDLQELTTNSLTLEENVNNFEIEVDKVYEDSVVNMNYLTLLNNFKATYKEKNKKIKDYLSGATTTKEENVDNTDNSENNSNNSDNNNKENNNSNSTDTNTNTDSNKPVTIITNYSVTQEGTDDYFSKILEDIENRIKAYTESINQNTETENNNNENTDNNTENVEKTDEEIEQEKKNKFNENKAKIDELYNKYKEALGRETSFYNSNINLLLNDSNTKMTGIIGQINSDINIENDIFTYTKYVYIDLPNNLNTYLLKNNNSSVLELNNLNNSLYNELKNLVKVNMSIKKMYDKMSDDIKKS